MLVLPAIDLMDGNAVRLEKGLKEKATIYSDNPAEMAAYFKQQGAEVIHVVDLDAAFGIGDNKHVIKQIISVSGIKVQVGGGIRSYEYTKELIDLGVERVIVGTAAFKDKDFFDRVLSEFGEKVALALDIKEGRIAIKGWVETVADDYVDFLKKYEAKGLKTVIFTDISRDGMLTGPNIEDTKRLVDNTRLQVVASGGMASLDNVRQLMQIKGLYGFITGKAIYENKFTVAQAVEMVKGI